MSERFQCGDNAALVGYLYEECEPAERGMIAAHVAMCAACAAELAALESTRLQLASWAPPEVALGFAITRREPDVEERQLAEERQQHARILRVEADPRARSWFTRPLPAWAQVAAAAAIFAAGLTLGIGTAPASTPGASIAATAPAPQAVSPGELAALERRLRDEIAQIRTASTQDTSATEVEGQLMARVRALIDESEQRQERELALRTSQIVRDFDSQRRVDLAQIQRNFGQIEGLTGAEVREQRQMLNYLMRVSQQQR